MKKLIKRIFIVLFILIVIGATILIVNTRKTTFNNIKAMSGTTIFGNSCYKDKEKQKTSKYNEYQKCDVYNLKDWVVESKTPGNNTIILNLQGGPVHILEGAVGFNPYEEKFVKLNKEQLDNSRRWLIGNKWDKFDMAFVKEIWMMKDNLYLSGYKIPFSDLEKEQAEYMNVLEMLIKDYKTKYDKVILLGHSYGSFQVNELLRTKGTIADGFVSLAGRLKMPDQVVNSFKNKRHILFDENGKVIKLTFEEKLLGFLSDLTRSQDMYLIRHAPVVGQYDFVKEIDTSKFTHNNIVWYTSQGDAQVGVFNEREKAFAKNNGKLLFATKDYMQKQVNDIKSGVISKDILLNKDIEEAKEVQDYAHHFSLSTQIEIDRWIEAVGI